MEGLEISEVLLSNVKKESYSERIDSFYFQKEFLKNKYSNAIELSNICEINSGTTPKDRDENLKNGIILLKTDNIRNGILTFNSEIDYFFIDNSTNNKMKSTELKNDDVLINIVGATTDVIGRCSLLSNDFPKANITQAMALLRIKKDYQDQVNPYFLFTFLTSKWGHKQIRRIARPTGQYNMNLQEVGSIKIPIINFDLQNKIKSLLFESNQKKSLSQSLYGQAEELLLETIGLKNYTPSQEKTNIKNYKESFLETGRLDAEYYQQKYEEIIKAVKNHKEGFSRFESFIDNYSTGYPYKSETYISENGIPLVRINNITKEGLDLSNAINIPKHDLYLSEKDIASENDILISMSGTIGLSCIVREEEQVVINQRIMRITSKNFNPQVLSLILNSIIGKYQLEQIGTGGVQTNISSNDIKNIIIPIIESTTQEKIAAWINESFALRKESERLLTEAKEMVEREIEKGI